MFPLAVCSLVVLALLLSMFVTPLVIRLCRAHQALDQPGERKIHARGVPRLGGVAIFVAVSLGLVAAVFGVLGELADIPTEQARLVPVIYLGLCGFFLIGFIDDLRSLPAVPRLLAQLAVAIMVVSLSGESGVRISSILGQYTFPEWLSIVITVLWIVGVVNTFNWIDGLDGLALGIAGFSAIAFLTLGLLKPGLPNAVLTVALSALLIGAALGLLRFNFHPARIFIGDGGAFSLGYLLAVISIIGLFKQAAVISFLVPVAILLLPLSDTAFAIIRRLWRGRPVTAPDNRHIHHRMLDLLSRRYRREPVNSLNGSEEQVLSRAHRNTVLTLYLLTALFAGLAIILGTKS